VPAAKTPQKNKTPHAPGRLPADQDAAAGREIRLRLRREQMEFQFVLTACLAVSTASTTSWSMIFSEDRYPLFGIML
jgi:hypothetical protein